MFTEPNTSEMESEGLLVLATSMYSDEMLASLRQRLPGVDFMSLSLEGDVPDGGDRARVLLRCFMSKPALQRALAAAPSVEWIHTCTAGFDQLLIPEIEERDLRVTRSAATTHIPISEWVLACMLHLGKQLPLLAEAQAERRWAEPDPIEFYECTVGIIGAGAIGTEVARRCKGFGMRVIATKRTPVEDINYDLILPSEGLHDLLEQSDFIVVTCPLTTETRGLIGYQEMQMMKPTAYLVNIARGAIVVEDDLRRALEEGLIAGAALDVFTEEPLPPESPLWNTPRLMITPHSSFRSPNSSQRGLDEFVANMKRYLAGEPLMNLLKDAELGY